MLDRAAPGRPWIVAAVAVLAGFAASAAAGVPLAPVRLLLEVVFALGFLWIGIWLALTALVLWSADGPRSLLVRGAASLGVLLVLDGFVLATHACTLTGCEPGSSHLLTFEYQWTTNTLLYSTDCNGCAIHPNRTAIGLGLALLAGTAAERVAVWRRERFGLAGA